MSNYLEVDSKILEKNLLLQTETADNFEKFLRSPENYSNENAPWKLATPVSGGDTIQAFLQCTKLHSFPQRIIKNKHIIANCVDAVGGSSSLQCRITILGKPKSSFIHNNVELCFWLLCRVKFLKKSVAFYYLPISSTSESWLLCIPNARITRNHWFCVKTTDASNNKIFINVCKLDDIPEPKDITETELLELWQSEETSDYRIPISIQDPHEEFDKSGNPTVAYDVAINTKFFKKIRENIVFQSFVMQVILEGLENKYNLSLKKEGFVILQNRKCLGDLRPHRIRINKTPHPASRQLIQELSSVEVSSGSGDRRIRKIGGEKKPCECRFFENIFTKFLIGEFYLPNVVNSSDMFLEIGEDRIIMECRRGYGFADFFFPVKINESEAIAQFNVCSRILTVKMPIVADTPESFICNNYS